MNIRRFSCALLLLSLSTSIRALAADNPSSVDLAPGKVKVDGVEVLSLGFDKLSSFPYKITDAGTGATPEEIAAAMKKDQVPTWLRAYDNVKIALTGYMMPLQIENGKSKKFVMMRDINTCCYGAVPNMNDFVVCTMKGPGIDVVQDVPVQLVGIFHVDQKYEGGYVVSLFMMDGEKFLGPKK